MLLCGIKFVYMKKYYMVGYFMVIVSDVMVIKFGLQFVFQVNGIIGLNGCLIFIIDKVMELKFLSEDLVFQFFKDSKFRI